MGMYHSTYFAYGIQIPDTRSDVIEETELGEGVGYLKAGNYDADMTFLVTECNEVSLGNFETVTPQSFTRYERTAWDTALRIAAEQLGVTPKTEPGWITVPNCS